MVYSTCTFSKKENEEVIEYVLEKYPEMKVLPITKHEGFIPGLTANTKNCARLYPHKIKGEGHFVALLQKGENRHRENKKIRTVEKPDNEFFKNVDLAFTNGDFIKRDNKLYFEPDHDFDLKGLRIMRSGLYLGEYRHERFEPSIALAMALKNTEYKNIIDLSIDDERVLKYLRCETLNVSDYDVNGYVLICAEGYPLGFGTVNKGILKNKYPANYRYK